MECRLRITKIRKYFKKRVVETYTRSVLREKSLIYSYATFLANLSWTTRNWENTWIYREQLVANVRVASVQACACAFTVECALSRIPRAPPLTLLSSGLTLPLSAPPHRSRGPCNLLQSPLHRSATPPPRCFGTLAFLSRHTAWLLRVPFDDVVSHTVALNALFPT